ncbi:MAG: hypothetical protein LBH19_10905, partial [Dysgonamonadaceae bacterium]|nr:hypothetical protein [Dysgonamonadaceae bacterium]
TAGNLLAFTAENYEGLEVYDFSNQSALKVSDEQGAGFQPVFSEDGNLFYKNTVYKSRLRYDGLKSYDLQKKTVQTILEPLRDLKPAQKYGNGVMVIQDQKLLKAASGKPEKTTPPYVWSDGRNLNIHQDGKTGVLNPIENANGYVWASLSPNGKMILFHAVAAGTYVSDLKGNIIASLGYLNAPVWYDNAFVAGMQDKDDGNNIVESIIILKSLNGKITKQLSEPGQKAMYPTASSVAKRVAYNTTEGDIYVVELDIIK